MCIVFVAYRYFESCPLLILDNRDEFLDRDTSPLHKWDEYPELLGSRDLERGGTWMAVNEKLKRFIILTNKREPYYLVEERKKLKSRGAAVVESLLSSEPVHQILEKLQAEKEEYAGFNLIFGDFSLWKERKEELWYFGSYLKDNSIIRLLPGKVYGLCNDTLDFPWAKLKLGVRLTENMTNEQVIDVEESFKILQNEEKPSKEELYSTGLENMDAEYACSSIFVEYKYTEGNYATRTSSILMIKNEESKLYYYERNYENLGFKEYKDTIMEIEF